MFAIAKRNMPPIGPGNRGADSPYWVYVKCRSCCAGRDWHLADKPPGQVLSAIGLTTDKEPLRINHDRRIPGIHRMVE
jgi:hypothetical protein